MSLDREALDGFLRAMLEELEGDWILIGGALVALWLEPRRVTEDIDVVGMEGTQTERLSLMRFAESHGLPIEAVNTAADFFLRRIEGWEREVELFREGPKARIFRPSATLFLLLKMRRLSERDLRDCLALLGHVRSAGLSLDRERALEELSGLAETADPDVGKRREALRQALEEA